MLFNKFFDYPLVASNVLQGACRSTCWSRRSSTTSGCASRQDQAQEVHRPRLRELDDPPVRQDALPDLLRPVHREGVGHAAEPDLGRLGEPAHHAAQPDWDTIKKTLFRPKAGRTRRGPSSRASSTRSYGGIGELARGYARKIEEISPESRVLVNSPAVRVLRDGMSRVRDRVRQAQARDRRGRPLRQHDPDHRAREDAFAFGARHEARARTAANSLKYISIVFVYLKLNRPQRQPRQLGLPARAASCTVHRIAEFKNFSQALSAPEGKTMVCAEITCRRGDQIWRADPRRAARRSPNSDFDQPSA